MPRWVQVLLHVAALLTAMANNFTAIFPPKYQGAVNLGIVLFSATVGYIAHSYNTDGTPQETPFVKPEAK